MLLVVRYALVQVAAVQQKRGLLAPIRIMLLKAVKVLLLILQV